LISIRKKIKISFAAALILVGIDAVLSIGLINRALEAGAVG
jgi:hypothetical protein